MKEKRRHKRFIVEGMNIHARTLSAIEVDIVNISLGGLSIVSPKRLNIGGKYHLKFEGIGGPVFLQAEVMWAKLSGSRDEPGVGIIPVYTAGMSFQDTMSPKMQQIKNYIESLETEPKQRLTGVRFHIKSREKATLDVPASYTVKKLSLGGMLIGTGARLDVDERMAVELVLPGCEASLDCTGRVASCIQLQEDDESFDIGLEFMDMTEKAMACLRNFVETLEIEAP